MKAKSNFATPNANSAFLDKIPSNYNTNIN